jgi:hypothetical protein
VTRRRLILAMLATALALPALALALPRSTSAYLLGPRMIRAEIALKSGDGVVHGFWLDRGRLTKRYSGGALIVLERDGTKATVKTASSARVTLNGKPSNLRALRVGMQVVVTHDRELPADAVYAGTKVAPKLPLPVLSFLLGPRMMRAEIPLQSTDGVTHDFRLDQGRIKQATPAALVVHEGDGTNATVPVSPFARVKLNGQNAGYSQLKKGMLVTVIRDGDKPADQIFATGK